MVPPLGSSKIHMVPPLGSSKIHMVPPLGSSKPPHALYGQVMEKAQLYLVNTWAAAWLFIESQVQGFHDACVRLSSIVELMCLINI